MAIDIFNPEISTVVKGIKGKLIFIYGTNSTGKTKNLVQAEKPLVCAFENGLNAINGIANIKIKKWQDWQQLVKQLTTGSEENIQRAHDTYSTIIIDTADGMANLAADFVAAVYNAPSVADGRKGYGLWKEYSAEIEKWLKLLTNSNYTVCFIAHEGEREFADEKGIKYSKIYPRGDKRVIDPICDLCDIIGYAKNQPYDAQGNEVNSTIYLKPQGNFHARSRFNYMPNFIPEWNIQKFESALEEAIAMEEKMSGIKALTLDQATKVNKENEKKIASKASALTFDELVNGIGLAVQNIGETTGNIEPYCLVLEETLGNREFKVCQASPTQRDVVEMVYEAMQSKGMIE